MRPFALIFTMLLIFSCNNHKGYAPERELVKFDRKAWDELVKQNKVIYKSEKNDEGGLASETYFFGDTASYVVEYDSKSRVNSITHRNGQQLATWIEFYYPNGVRKARYMQKAYPKTGVVYEGLYEEYYESGKLKTAGMYKDGELLWEAPFDKDGTPKDTVVYE